MDGRFRHIREHLRQGYLPVITVDMYCVTHIIRQPIMMTII